MTDWAAMSEVDLLTKGPDHEDASGFVKEVERRGLQAQFEDTWGGARVAAGLPREPPKKWISVIRTGRFSVAADYEVPEDASEEAIIELVCDDSEWDITDGEWETESIEVAP